VASDFSYCCVFDTTPGSMSGGLASMLGVRGNFAADPLFADRANGDYHVKSRAGRWNQATSAWVTDTVTSPCIDAGDPASAFASEPAPNGGRVNMGSDGNTAYASKTAAPTVIAKAPKGNSVWTGTNITATFDTNMTRTSVNNALTINGKKASTFGGAFSWSDKKMIFNPTANLKANTSYTIVIGTGAKSAAGLNLATAFTWTFKTRAATAPPQLSLASAPTAPGAQITLNPPSAANVHGSILNLAGREVAVLQPGDLAAGVTTLLWNGKCRSGTRVPAGTYLLQVSVNDAGGTSAKAMTSLQLR